MDARRCAVFLTFGFLVSTGTTPSRAPAAGPTPTPATGAGRAQNALHVGDEGWCVVERPEAVPSAAGGEALRSTVPPLQTGPPCLPALRPQDIFVFEDSADLLVTNFSDADYLALRVAAVNSLIAVHGDHFDFVGFWLSFAPHHTIGIAHYSEIWNESVGFGMPPLNYRSSLGMNTSRVQGLVTMWRIDSSLWAPGAGTTAADTTRYVLAHEFEHRFALYLPALADGRRLQSGDGCGPVNASHWNSRVDGQGSAMDLREWIGSGPAVLGGDCLKPGGFGVCMNTDAGGWYSFTDLYLMGYVSPQEMDAGNSELRYMNNGCISPYNGPISSFSSADIITTARVRVPSSAGAQKHFRAAWVMLHRPGQPPSSAQIDRAVAISAQQQLDWPISTIFRGTLSNSLSADCNCNGTADADEIAAATSFDCNGDAIPDECHSDCNANTLPDPCEIQAGTALDCNQNGLPDGCDLASAGSVLLQADFNAGLPPGWTVTGDSTVTSLCMDSGDCSEGDYVYLGRPANCDTTYLNGGELGLPPVTLPATGAFLSFCSRLQLVPGQLALIRADGVIVSSEGSTGSQWVHRRVPLPGNGAGATSITFQFTNGSIQSGTLGWSLDNARVTAGSTDCNGNLRPDECDLADGFLPDCTGNGIADLCEVAPDCNGNGMADFNDLCLGSADDCNANGTPDTCEPDDCNGNDIPDECEADCNLNGVPDECDESDGTSFDCDTDGALDECQVGPLTQMATYLITSSNLNNLPSNCPAGPFNGCLPTFHPGFTWQDTLGGVVVGVRVDVNVGVNCPDDGVTLHHHHTALNGVATGEFIDTDPLCPCSASAGRLFSIDLERSAYLVGGSNVFRITDPLGCMGLAPRAEFFGAFARVTVAYNDGFADCNTNQVPDACDLRDGTSQDSDLNGLPDECQIPVPAASTWGMLALALLLLTGGTLVAGRAARGYRSPACATNVVSSLANDIGGPGLRRLRSSAFDGETEGAGDR